MADISATLAAFFTDDHRVCDDLWSELETAADAGDAALAGSLWTKFDTAMLHHLDMEEQVLFPAFESATGMHGGGPTHVMRMEHQQMRGLMRQMGNAVSAGDLEGLVDHGDTLLMLMQQHNVKEERMLYPMAEQTLGSQWAQLAAKLEMI